MFGEPQMRRRPPASLNRGELSRMNLQHDVSPISPADHLRVVEVWEASVRATHHFVSEADIEFFRPLVRDGLNHVPALIGMRDETGQVAGFVGVADGKVEMLFLHPDARGQGIGRRLLTYAITALGATSLDVNEQNEQAVGFYLHMGFEVIGRSELDGTGKPYPLLHMRYAGAPSEAE
jgi:putative acetyltransferase